ncbi:hypothetical protein [Geothrix sp. 21YS21S-4]|uniref:hypothetical protein n=1 Tax=Geothrix sp. 21YS21S-4 TaxID=3068889 RepID=UPI0027BA33F2|nr:hypothetical protein [Geothrix sp. 21YS21S-4]
MKARVLLGALLLLAAGTSGYLLYRDALVPVPLQSGRDLFVPAQPAFGEDEAVVESVLPAGPGLEAFLAAQSDLALLEKGEEGQWTGQLLAGLQRSRHGRRWRLTLVSGWRMQDGTLLDAHRLVASLASAWAREGCVARIIDPATVELRFPAAPADLPARLATWRVPGSGPFIRQGSALIRFEGFSRGRAGLAGLRILSEPAVLSSRAWAEGLASGRWAWAAFPGSVAPEDMARVRRAPYDELRLKDGSVWFLSRRMRRLRPNPEDWTRTRLFGAWKGAVDLLYEP